MKWNIISKLFVMIFVLAINSLDLVAQFHHFEYVKQKDNSPTITNDGSVWMELQPGALDDVRNNHEPLLLWDVNIPGEGTVTITLLESCPFQESIPFGRRVEGENGGVTVEEDYHKTKLKSYDLTGPSIGGSMVISETIILASIRYKGRLFELRPVNQKVSLQDYVLFDVNESKVKSSFTCAADELSRNQLSGKSLVTDPLSPQSESVLDCVEIGIDIDKYTFDTFSNCENAIDWALTILVGVDEIYRTELSDLITLQASYINIWEVTDPYSAFVEDFGPMLDELRNTWMIDPILSAANHDLIHLMTKRSNTGTGGVAWLGGVCNSYGVGFSSYLDNNTTTTLPNYTWNLDVVTHEIGHNFGANHTHWCGWPGGPIDNCGDFEGPCGDYVNNPTAQVGTIMSYCHAISGGSKTLVFHDIVKTYGLIPSLNGDGSCHGDCAGIVTSCGSYGCTDSSSCNYDPDAVNDDGSCGDFDVCGVCVGNGSSCTGCTDASACNFDIDATINDGGCIYPPLGFACDCASYIDVSASLSGSDFQEFEFTGVGTLTSFDLTVVFNNPSNGGSWPGDMMIEIISPEGNCASFGGYDVNSMCLDGSFSFPGEWNVTASGTYYSSFIISASAITGDGVWIMRVTNAWTTSSVVDYELSAVIGGVCSGPPAEPGCMDDVACNYNFTATIDDGSCEFTSCSGCTDVDACNYLSEAIIDDGTCEFESCLCLEDINQDGIISVADLLLMLGEFSCQNSCNADINSDGVVSVEDLLLLLAAFGQSC
jgi:hypothetical protein